MSYKNAGGHRIRIEFGLQLGRSHMNLLTVTSRSTKPSWLEHIDNGVRNIPFLQTCGGLKHLFQLIGPHSSQDDSLPIQIMGGPVEPEGTDVEQMSRFIKGEQVRYHIYLGNHQCPNLPMSLVKVMHHNRGGIVIRNEQDP